MTVVGIDARLLAYRRGMGNFLHGLVSEYVQQGDRYHFILYGDSPKVCEQAPMHSSITTKLLTPSFYPVWEQIVLPRQAWRDRVDVLHCPANTGPISLAKAVKMVVTIHDVMFLLPKNALPLSPSLYQRLGRKYRRWVVPRVAQRASIITTDSHYSRDDVQRWIGISGSPIEVIYGAPSPMFERWSDDKAKHLIANRFGIKGPFLFALGAIDPRKNTSRIIRAFAKFHALTRTSHCLVISGLSGVARSVFAEYAQLQGVADSVHLLSFVNEEELIALYNAADAFVYPSLYEGFGFPVVEAMACGTPVIASNSTSIPEVARDAAMLIDPQSTSALIEAMTSLVTNLPMRQMYSERGLARAQTFSWRLAAREMLSIYEKVAAT